MTRFVLLLAVAFACLPGVAMADSMTMPPSHSAAPSEAERANAAAMDRMMRDMMAKPTGHPDQDFATMMTAHHQGAIDMAKVELQYGKDPALRDLATKIIAAQEGEIAVMKAWLASR